MFKIEEEIRDFLEAGMTDSDAILDGNVVPSGGATVTVFVAQPPTASRIVIQPVSNTGDVKAGAVTFSGTDGDSNSITEDVTFVDNDTRKLRTNKLFKTITSIVWLTQDGSTGEWDVGYSKINRYYVGSIKPQKIPNAYLPALTVVGTNEDLISNQLSTARDKYTFSVKIKVIINAFSKVNATSGVDDDNVLDVQKHMKQLIAERDADMKPIATSVLGLLRSNVRGVDYLFSNNVSIAYEEENIAGTQYFIGTVTVDAITRLNSR